ncbi:MAG: hypothetical protein JXB23_10750 [Candidatus Aminicenantes bacterium]|nr:hypothetical protein [Candidatus Aminicenantes bacterium]
MKLSKPSYSRVKKILMDLVAQAPENLLADFGNIRLYDTPLVGIADGDDPLFQTFRDVVSPRHLLPREILKHYADKKADLSRIAVISWVLPYSERIRQSNRQREWPSKLYSLARNNGGALNYRTSLRFMQILRDHAVEAVSPIAVEEYDAFRSPDFTFSSTWSQRHVAFAAGLGYFGLNGSLITPLGANIRLGSIITNLDAELPPSRNRNFRAPCLDEACKECRACMIRCPVSAISSHGLDKEKCYAMRKAVRKRHMDQYAKEMNMIPSPIVKNGVRKDGYSLGCALCQCGVPCEDSDPFEELKSL